MQNRRKLLFMLSATFVGMALVVASALADEVLGFITKVDADAKKITVVTKDKDEELVLETNADTEYIAKKGEEGVKVDKEVYEKLEKSIEKAKEKNRKGVMAKITYDKKIISKIQKVGGRGKKAQN